MRHGATILFGVVLSVTAALGDAATPGESREALQPLLSCRGETDPGARLACYDKATDALKAATEKRDIIVVDKAEVQKARRSLFGFALPSLKLFGGDDRGTSKRAPSGIDDDVNEITTTVRSAREDADGLWIVTMADGAVWHQTGGMLGLRPRPGNPVTIRRGALGSYFMRVGSQPGVKARRES